MQVPHRPGPLHQVNKRHGKAKLASSGREAKTKTPLKLAKPLTRKQRLQQLEQIRLSKKDQSIRLKKKVGTLQKAPLVVGWLDQTGKSFVAINEGLKAFKIIPIDDRSIYVESLQFRCKLINLNPDNLFECLDLVKRLDVLILVHDPNTDFDLDENKLVRAIRIHCLPTTIHLILGETNQIGNVKKQLKTIFKDEKIMNSRRGEYSHVFQALGNCKRVSSKFRESRPAIETDSVEVIDNCLTFTGFVRNKRLSPNDLVHIANYDDYRISRIDILPDLGGECVQSIFPDPMHQETLEQENDLDPMEGEQTWPTAEELALEAEKQNTRRIRKKLPIGTSSYQEAWIPDEEDIPEGEDDEEDEEVDEMDEDDADTQDGEDGTEDEDCEMDEENFEDAKEEVQKDDEYEEETHMDTDVKQAIQFPDEIDTPNDIPARVRFARYRGLKSFRTSSWDPQENLPPEYARIFQFKNFQQTKKTIMNKVPESGVDPGLYVRIWIENVPTDLHDKIKQTKPNIVGLLKHERKMTVMNFVVKALPEMETPIRSKEELLFIVGYRKFLARPIFSAHTISSRFKNEKFLYNDRAMVATVFAPVTFPPAPVLVFRKRGDQYDMVASGSVLDSNPNRMIIKRIRLSGHPFKIHSKSAVIRFMFFNSEDIMYFKPVELVTRYNRRGHITEPLGTHGHMKCLFDRKIRSDDCVFMNLYKRVFPKWTYSPVYGL